MALAAAVLFGLSVVTAADVFASVSPMGAAQIRSILAALILGAIAYRRGLTAHRGQLWWLALLGLNLALVTVASYLAIDRLGVGPGSTIQFTGPVLVLAWMRLVEKRPVPLVAWLVAGAAVIGTGLMTQAWHGDLDALGVAAGVVAAFTFASYLVLGERLGAALPSLTVLAYGFAFSALIWLVVLPPQWSDLGTGAWARLVLIATIGTVAPFLLEISALRRADPGSVGVVATAEPVVGAAVAWFALGQALTPVQLVGGTITVLAIAGIHHVTSRRTTWPG
jgi:drug/metabolite transporter (DMT)-like permease